MYERYWEAVAQVFTEDPPMVAHTKRVFAFVQRIAGETPLTERERKVADIAAIFHDIGIAEAKRKYGSCEGHYQHLEGPPIARSIMESVGEERDVVERVLYIVGHHHDFAAIDGRDFQVLVEADILVNFLEGKISRDTFRDLVDQVFATEAGKRIAREMLLK